MKKIVLAEIDPSIVQREIEDFIIAKVCGAGLRGGVVGLSGGIDSSTVAYLAASAFRRYSISNPMADKLALLGVILPADISSPNDERDALTVAKNLGIEFRTISIQPMVNVFLGALPGDGELDSSRNIGNLMSEIRAVTLSRLAAARKALILGTGNKDEDYCLGYFTKRGDGAVDISPIGALSKRNLRKLARHMGVPENIVNRVPTAGLWPGQTDEKELGFSYDFAELVIAGMNQGMAIHEIVEATNSTTENVERVLSTHKANRHKMSMPEIAPITYMRG